MKKIYKIIVTILIMTSFNIVYAHNGEDYGFNVLILNSYHQGHCWESSIEDGLLSRVEEHGENYINFKIEYLDFRNKNDKEYIDSLKEMLEAKYPKGSIDVVYTVDDESYEAFQSEILNEKSEFYQVPLLFSGIDNKIDGTVEEKQYMSGIYHRDDSLDLFNFINRLNTNTDTINLIIENSLYCDSVKGEIDSLINGYLKEHINVNYIRSDFIEDIENQLEKLGENNNSVNIIAGEFQYKGSRKYVDPYTAIESIKKYNKSPIFSNDQTYLNAGILGGHIDIGSESGAIIADMIIDIKNGKDISNIQKDIEPKAKAYIDYKSIYEYNINPLYVSEDINIINKEWFQLLLPTWQKTGICFFIAIISLIGILSISIILKYRKNRIKKEDELKKAEERANLKTDFIVNLSHELRTPINIILGTSKVLEFNIKKHLFDEDDISTKLNNIKQNSYRLLKISNNIIDITKADSGMLKLKLENCNIVEIIEDTFTSSIDFANRKNIDMLFDTNTEELITAVDIFQIQRVILNLLSNSIKYTDDGGKIEVFISKENKDVVISVKDNGIGIPSEKINYIFHRFYQVDNLLTRKSEGSGIGLCISKDIVEIHGGKIEVYSEEGKGSTFKVYIPIKHIDQYTENDNQKILDINRIVDVEMSDI